MKLWVDDIREPPSQEWVWAKSYEDALGYLGSDGINFDCVSLDHDLGEVKSGYDILNVIEEWIIEYEWTPPRILVHTSNPVGRENMNRAIESINKLSVKK